MNVYLVDRRDEMCNFAVEKDSSGVQLRWSIQSLIDSFNSHYFNGIIIEMGLNSNDDDDVLLLNSPFQTVIHCRLASTRVWSLVNLQADRDVTQVCNKTSHGDMPGMRMTIRQCLWLCEYLKFYNVKDIATNFSYKWPSERFFSSSSSHLEEWTLAFPSPPLNSKISVITFCFVEWSVCDLDKEKHFLAAPARKTLSAAN